MDRIEAVHYRSGKAIKVFIRDGNIAHIEETPGKGEAFPLYVAPGLVDLQVNGFEGVDFADPDLTQSQIRDATRAIRETGTTTFFPTLITNDHAGLRNSFLRLAAALDDPETNASIPGFHLEGPYISPEPGYRGAHLAKHIRNPDWEEFQILQQVAHGKIKLITLAPESPGAISFIEKCTACGVKVALGHHNAPPETVRAAAAAGATLVTHLGNGCANTVHRHENPFWSQLAEDRLAVTLISDGAHLTADELTCFYRVKGKRRTVLVSDTLDLAGLPPGEYPRGERKVVMTGDVIRFPEENVLAGAVRPLSRDIAVMQEATGCSLADAIDMAAANPARLMGLKRLGTIRKGYRADLMLFTLEEGNLVVQQTLIAGKLVFTKYRR